MKDDVGQYEWGRGKIKVQFYMKINKNFFTPNVNSEGTLTDQDLDEFGVHPKSHLLVLLSNRIFP